MQVVWINAVLCLISPTQASYVAVYSLGAHARRTFPAGAGFVVLVACWALGAQSWRLVDPISSLVLLTCGVLFGVWIQARRALLDSLTDRADRAERERLLSTELAISQYRARLTTDVHDTVGHWVSLMVLQAGALKVSTHDEGARRAAGTIGAYGGQATAELRDLLQKIHTEEDPLGTDPLASFDALDEQLNELVGRAQRAGLSVSFQWHGSRQPLDEPVTKTAFRIVQESLTNAAKHAPGSHVEVVVDERPSEVLVEITNTNHGYVPVAEDPSGTGLIGLRRRVALVGGRLETGPTADGAFEVRAVLPRVPAKATTTAPEGTTK